MSKTSEELKYLNDCLVMDRLAEEQFGLTKQANPISDMLGGLTSSILNASKNEIENNGLKGGLANIMIPAIMFRISPLFATFYQIAHIALGFDITDVYSKIMQHLSPKLHAGQQILPEEIDKIGNSIAGQIASQQVVDEDAGLEKTQSLHLGGLEKLAQRYAPKDIDGFTDAFKNFLASDKDPAKHQVNWFLPHKGVDGKKVGVVEKIFGNLLQVPRGKSKAVWFIVGIVTWFIKTLLFGIGLLAIGNYVKGKLPNSGTSTQPTIKDNIVNGYNLSTNHQEKKFPNNSEYDWEIDLVNNSVQDTLLAWVKDIYPKLNISEDQLTNSTQFLRIEQIMAHNFEPENLPKFKMPKGFTSRKQVVDMIVMPLVNNHSNN